MNNNLRTVTKYERAGNEGKELTCPQCGMTWIAGHFDWSAFTCCKCRNEIAKLEWLCEKEPT